VQFTIIEEPAKRLWYPMWREKDQQVWNHFHSAGEKVASSTQPEAQEYINKWSRTFPVLTISRPYLNSIGLTIQQIHSLSDEDMTRIVEILVAHHFDSEFEEEVVFTARLILAEKR